MGTISNNYCEKHRGLVIGELAIVRKGLLDNYPSTRKALTTSQRNHLDELFDIEILVARYNNLSLELKNLIDNFGFSSLKLADNGSDIIFLAANGTDEVGRIVGDLLHVKYAYFGGDIVCNKIRTTTCIGKWKPGDGSGTWIIIDSKMSRYGENPGGVNILNDSRNTLEWSNQRIWDEINQPWLDAAIVRGDNIRAVSDPLDIKNVFADTKNIPTSVFSSPETLFAYLKNLNDPEVITQLSFYGREIKHLSANNYLFDLTSKMFVK